jgi:WD40 repeat protein
LDHLIERELSEERRRYLEKTLNPDIALRRTAYDDQGKPPCDEDTRIDILAQITTWVNDVSPRNQNFFWLTGDPGCGKSAITASLARYCKGAGILWAQFFINRNNEATTHPRVYFPSIAHQMAEYSSNKAVEKVIYDILKASPCLLDGMTVDQARVLFVQVVQVACDLDKGKPVVIVIDGLDETDRKSLKDTATIFSKLFKEMKRSNAKVFISSRTDDEITKPFYRSLQSNKDHMVHLHLDTSDPSSIEDVSKYLSRNLQRLVEEWDLNWGVWPDRERYEKLCRRAAGLFIWAATVVRFFEEQLRVYGQECLDGLLDAISAEGMDDVNNLYQTILTLTFTANAKSNLHAWAHETFRWVVGFMIALKEPLPIGDVGALLDLRRTPTSNSIDILRFTTNLRTVLVAGTGDITKDTIPRLHKSFVEFVTSDAAAKAFRIDTGVVDVEIALKCLQLVRRLRNSDDRSRSVHYAIHNWTRHLPNEGIASGLAVFGDDEAFFRIYRSTTELGKSVMSFSGDYRTHVYDPEQGIPPPAPLHFSHSGTIQVGDRVEAIAISMDGRLIASGTNAGDIHLWDGRSHKPIAGPPREHYHTVRSVCFSPDSRWLVSGGFDASVRVWDCQTGQAAAGSPLLGHTDINSVCTDGSVIISGSYDNTIRIWSLTACNQLGMPIDAGGHVSAVALSNDGRIAAAVGHDVHIWDVKTRLRIASLEGHTSTVWTVAFSADNSHIASGSSDNSVRLWDTRTCAQIREFTGHTASVRSIASCSDGRWITSGSDNTVHVWHSNTGQLIDPPLEGHTDVVKSVAVSPGNGQLISGSHDKTVRIWSTSARKEWSKLSAQITSIHISRPSYLSAALPSHTVLVEDNPSIIAACYSPDRTLYAASTLGGHVSLWNTTHDLLWESDTPIHPIHLLKLSAERLIISSPDGSSLAWRMVDGKPAHQARVISGPQLNTTNIHRLRLQSSSSPDNPIVRWFPFKVEAGSWAYVDGTFIRFESVGGGSVTFIDVGDFAQ